MSSVACCPWSRSEGQRCAASYLILAVLVNVLELREILDDRNVLLALLGHSVRAGLDHTLQKSQGLKQRRDRTNEGRVTNEKRVTINRAFFNSFSYDHICTTFAALSKYFRYFSVTL